MKKNILLIASMAVCGSVFALSPTATAWITLTSDNAETDVVKLVEEPSCSAAWETGDATKAWNTQNPVTNVNVYVQDPTFNAMQSIITNNLRNTKIGIKPNQTEVSYKFTFSKLTGRSLKMYDVVEDSLFTISSTTEYEFTVESSQLYTQINDRFIIDPIFCYKREVLTDNWGTICYPDSITAVEGADIYQIVAINSAKTKVAVDEVNVLNMKPGKAYLFQATADKQVFTYFYRTAVKDSIQNNGLIGTFKGLTLAEQKWVLTDNTITPAAVGSTVGQYRCYIDLGLTPVDDSKFVAGAPGRKIFDVVGGQTDLENVDANANANRKMMINGKLVIIRDGKMFNAQGMEL